MFESFMSVAPSTTRARGRRQPHDAAPGRYRARLAMTITRVPGWLCGLWLAAACTACWPTPPGEADDGTLANDGFEPDRADTPPRPPRVVLNEVETSGGVPGDWAELLNTEPFAVDLGGWQFKDG